MTRQIGFDDNAGVLTVNGQRCFSIGSTYDNATGLWIISRIETRWSCPVHDYDTTDYGEDGLDTPVDIECLDCLFGADRPVYDGDGWMTLGLSWRYLDPGLEGHPA